MDFEAPGDAWYVWVGVTVVSIGLAGFALSLPGQPPPDADDVAGPIERIAAGGYDASASVSHDATAVRIDHDRIAVRNEGGRDEAHISFGVMIPLWTLEVSARDRQALEAVVIGSRTLDESLESTLADAMTTRNAETGEWRPVSDSLSARAVTIDGERVVLIMT